jgi:uncharacterized Fe-S cluster-containing radical SAM superfamily protein
MTEYVSSCCEGKVREDEDDGYICLTCRRPCEAICSDCFGKGIVDADAGGGNLEEIYCSCYSGSRAQEQDEAALDHFVDCEIERNWLRKRGLE